MGWGVEYIIRDPDAITGTLASTQKEVEYLGAFVMRSELYYNRSSLAVMFRLKVGKDKRR